MHPGYSANIDLTCDEGELDRNPAFKALFNAIEDAINIYLDSGPKSVQEIDLGPEVADIFNKQSILPWGLLRASVFSVVSLAFCTLVVI